MALGFAFAIPYRRKGLGRGSGVGTVFVPVGARGRGIPGTAGTTTGAFDSFNGQNIFWAPLDQPITAMKVVYADWEMSAAGPVAKAAGAVFNNFAVGLNVQQVSQGSFLFSGGASTTLGAPSSPASFSYVMSDEKAVTIAANNSFGIRMYGSMTVGTDYATADYQNAAGGTTRLVSAPATPGGGAITGYTEGLTRASATPNTTTGITNPSHTGVGWLPPSIVLAKMTNPAKSGVLFGDSIAQHQSGDWPDDLGNMGYALRTVRNTMPFVNLSRGTLQAAFFNTSANRAGLDALTIATGMYVTDFVCGLGRNDLAASSSDTTTKTDVDFVCASQKAAGRRCWITTIPPTTTSTDGWASIPNQTIASSPKNTFRVSYNTDRRANYVAQGYRGVIDIATVLETASDGGLWRTPFANITLTTPITTVGQVGDIVVSDTSAYTAAGFTSIMLLIGTERIFCTIKDATTLTIVARGVASTTAATYIAGVSMYATLTNDGIHPNFNGHERIRLAGTFAASKFGT